MANLGYVIARELRKRGIETDLLIEKNPPKGSDPMRFDPTLETYPEWIVFYDKSNSMWKKKVIQIMRNKKYDIIHAYVEFPIFAYLARKTFVANTQGDDFRKMALTNTVRGILLRKAYKKAKAVLFFQPDHLPIFSKLKLNNGIFLPPMWDTEFYHPIEVEKREFSDKFVIFHPANLDWSDKGNDIFIKAYADFVKRHPEAFLIIVDRGIDSGRTHKLIEDLGVGEKVKFIPGPLKSIELLNYYNMADVVVDQFIAGSLGSIAWESFACEKPVLAYIHDEYFKRLYGESPPIVNAYNISQIIESLETLTDRKRRENLGSSGRKWLIKYHSSEAFIAKLLSIYNAIINEESLSELYVKL